MKRIKIGIFAIIIMLLSFIKIDAIIVDHDDARLDVVKSLTEKQITEAKYLNIVYWHTSHGSQLTTGLTGLGSFMSGLGYTGFSGTSYAGLNIVDKYETDLGASLNSFVNKTINYLNDNPETNVVMWSWCGQLGWMDSDQVETYLEGMTELEIEYPNITFVYMTGHLFNGDYNLSGTNSKGVLVQATKAINDANNKIIRDFCVEYDRPLFDFADIESYDPDNVAHLDAKDDCTYVSGLNTFNWCATYQDNHTRDVDWYMCDSAHSQPINANLKAYATYKLMASIAEEQFSDKTKVNVPTVSDLIIHHTGSAISPKFTYNDKIIRIKSGGTSSATDIGNYSFEFELIDPSEYEWNTTPEVINWSIVSTDTIINRNITIIPDLFGTVTASTLVSNYNEVVSLTITPDAGCGIRSIKFLETSNNRDVTNLVSYNNSTKTFIMPDYDVTIKVDFFLLQVSSAPEIQLELNSLSSIKVSWASVNNATSYEVYCSASKDGTYILLDIVRGLNYTHTGRTIGKTYYYKVKARNDNSTSGFSTTKNITVSPRTVTINNSKTTYYSASISWDKVSGVSGYIVYRSTDGKSWSKYKTLSNTYSSYTNTGLVLNKTYYYKVRTYAKVGAKTYYSSYSNVISTKPYLNTTTVTGYNTYYQYAKISYTKVNGASGYKVFRSDSENGTYKVLGYTTSTNYYDKTAVKGKIYYYKVRPYRAINRVKKYGTTSQSVSAMRVNDSITFTTVSNDYNSITLTINKLTDVTTYYVYRATSKSGTYKLIKTLNASDYIINPSVTYTDSKLTFNKIYYYKVRVKRTNTSAYSGYKYTKTRITKPVIDAAITSNNHTITISKVNGASAYQIYVSFNDGSYKLLKTTAELTYTNSNLVPGTYTYKVRAYRVTSNGKIYSLLSNEVSMPIM